MTTAGVVVNSTEAGAHCEAEGDSDSASESVQTDDEVVIHFVYSWSGLVHLVDDDSKARCGHCGSDSFGSSIGELRLLRRELCEQCESLASAGERDALVVAYS